MGIIQKDALRTTVFSYLGIGIGYVNKAILFIVFLTTDEIGLINLLVSVGMLFGNLAGFGVTQSMLKFFPFFRNKANRNHGFLTLLLGIMLLGIVLFSIVAFIFREPVAAIYSENSKAFVDYYPWIIPLGIANVMFLVLENYLRSLFKNIIPVIANEVVLRLLVTVLLVVYGFKLISFDQFLVLHCLAYFIPVAMLAFYLYRDGELGLTVARIAVPRRFRRIIVYFGFYSYVNTIGSMVVAALDAMMIAGMLGLRETGIYTTIIYLTNALQIPYRSMVRVSSPLIAKYWKEKNMSEMQKLYTKFSSVNLVIATVMFLVIWVCREEIFHFLPSEFSEGIYVFLFLMIGRLTDMYFGLNGIIFIMSKKYRYDVVFTVALIGIVAGLNIFMIPAYGVTGAAIATCIAYLVYNAGRLLFVYFAYDMHPFEKRQGYILALFTAVLCLFELMPAVFASDVLNILFKWLLLGVVFIAPIYFFRMEHEIVRYIDNGILFLKKKTRRK